MGGGDIAKLERALLQQERDWAITRDDVTALKATSAAIQQNVNVLNNSVRELGVSVKTDIEKIALRFEERRPNWIILCTVGSLFMGAFFWLIKTQVEDSVHPVSTEVATLQSTEMALQHDVQTLVNLDNQKQAVIADLKASSETAKAANTEMLMQVHKLEQSTATSLEAGADSKRDRSQLNTRVKELEDKEALALARVSALQARLETGLGEIEQQFRAVNNIDNKQYSEQMRINAMLWEKTHPGEHFPTDLFFPSSIFQNSEHSYELPHMGENK